MPTLRPILLASAAAAVLIAAACSRDVTAPGGPTIAGSPVSPTVGLFSISPSADTSGTDSVIGGYGCGPAEYQSFEYEPATGTEYVVCTDSVGVTRRLVSSGDTTPPPPPAPAPAPKPAPAPAPSTTTQTPAPAPAPAPAPTPKPAPEDSVIAGYGNESTGTP
jgi:hypothetical protein